MAKVANRWILVSSPSPDRETVAAASRRGGRVGGVRGWWWRLPRRWVPGPWTPVRVWAMQGGPGSGTTAPGGVRVDAASGRLVTGMTARRVGWCRRGRRCWEQRRWRRGTKNRIEVKVNYVACGKREVAR
jgi:hypothetical protein